jgi:hypothetical protein
MRRADRTSAMIEVHRAAEAAHMAACSAYSRRQQALIDEGIGLRPFTMLVSQGQPIAVYTHAQIDACADAHIRAQEQPNAHIDLDRVLSRCDEVVGNSEEEAGRLGDVASDALYDLISMCPRRLSALASWWPIWLRRWSMWPASYKASRVDTLGPNRPLVSPSRA